MSLSGFGFGEVSCVQVMVSMCPESTYLFNYIITTLSLSSKLHKMRHERCHLQDNDDVVMMHLLSCK